MHYCPTCHKPIWDAHVDATINAQFSPAYCQCPRLTIYLSEYVYEVAKSLSRQLAAQSTRVEVPQAFYDKLTDEEVQL